MKRELIQADGRTPYRAKIDYGRFTKVVVLEFGLVRDGRRRSVRDGVRVRLERPVRIFRNETPAGTEMVIGARDLERLWTDEDEQAALERDRQAESASEIADRLERFGFSVVRLGESRGLPGDDSKDAWLGLSEVRLTHQAVREFLDRAGT